MASEIQVQTEGDVVVVVPAGELDATTSPDLADVLDRFLTVDQTLRGVVIDFSRVTFCDSRCIGVLVAAYRQARDLGIGLAVSAPQRSVHRLLVIAGIDQVITVDHDTRHAVEAVVV